jgi:hypothetical protein
VQSYPSQLLATVEATGAAYARANHAYRNRSGNLERSTRAYMVSANFGAVTVVLEARMPYAKHVARLGYLNLAEAARIARAAVAALNRRLLR